VAVPGLAPDAVTVALGLVFGAYAVVVLGLAAVLWRSRPPAALRDGALPTVAITVAARDEEATIGRCLEALQAQDYPPEKLIVVVADDHSTDRTAEIVLEAARRSGPFEIRYVRVPDPVGHLRGKAQAIHTAIEAVDADLVLVTDADCAPVPTWARGMAAAFADPDVGISCGLAQVTTRPGRLFDRVQAFDWSLLLGAVAAAAEAGAPTTGMGNNMAVRRSVYSEVGGYPALPFCVTEDFALVQSVATQTDHSVRFPLDPATTVWTLPTDTVLEAYQQRRRWARGGLSGGSSVFGVYVILFAVHALVIAGIVSAPLWGVSALVVKAAADMALLYAVSVRIGRPADPLILILGEVFVTAYFVTLPAVLALRPRIGWKGRRH
ncbi:glycosyltransferase, partial [Rubrivirga sp.]|uniref:glycosyltransferase n=1 Tax=Rubrivirga sp. TaxID=1885344 RepID=UPI003C708883